MRHLKPLEKIVKFERESKSIENGAAGEEFRNFAIIPPLLNNQVTSTAYSTVCLLASCPSVAPQYLSCQPPFGSSTVCQRCIYNAKNSGTWVDHMSCLAAEFPNAPHSNPRKPPSFPPHPPTYSIPEPTVLYPHPNLVYW